MTPETPTNSSPAGNENTVEQAPSLISSITIKSIGCNAKAVAAWEEGDKRHLHLARVYGQITALIFGDMPDGTPYISLGGRFQAINMQEGTAGFNSAYESGKCFLPPGTHESLVGQARKIGIVEPTEDKRSKTVEKPLKDNKAVNFALDIFVARASNASGITYISKPLLEATEADPMRELRQAVKAFEDKLKAQAGNGATALPAASPATTQQHRQLPAGKK